MEKKDKKILLSFDVEEFDLPLEYGIKMPDHAQMRIGKMGLDAIRGILDDLQIQCTLFTTANFALSFPSVIKALSERHEIASHGFFHSSFTKEDLLHSRLTLENIVSKQVSGLRMPRMIQIEDHLIREAGYRYDSSLNPTWIPGRYNHLSRPRRYFEENGMAKIPASVSANLRIPLFWLAFKNLPYFYYKMMALQSLKKDGYLCLYFHPWEFTGLQSFKIPGMIKRKSGHELVEKLSRLISDLKNEGEFLTINSFLDANHKK